MKLVDPILRLSGIQWKPNAYAKTFIPGQNCDSLKPAPEDVVCILVEDGHSIEKANFSCSLCAISIGVEREGSTYGHTTNALCRIFFVGEGQSLDIVRFSRLFLPSKLTRACAACFIPGRIPIRDPNCLRIRERPSAKCQTNHEWNSPYSYPLEYKSPSTSSSFLYSCSLLSLYFVLRTTL